MQRSVIYSMRIKIVTMQFSTTPGSRLLTLKCLLNNHLLAQKDVRIADGLLAENTSITFELHSHVFLHSEAISIQFFESENTTKPIGSASISLSSFESMKMRRFDINTPRQEVAYMEAFLLRLQSRIVEEPEVSPINAKVSHCSQSQFSHSRINIDLDSSEAIEPESPKSTTTNEPILRKKSSQEAETQTYNIESLLTINAILEETNSTLEAQNQELKARLDKYEQLLDSQDRKRHIQNQYNLRIEEMNDQIERLKKVLRETEHALEQKTSHLVAKEQEVERKTALIKELKSENVRLSKQIEVKRSKQMDEEIKDLNLEKLMNELSRYSETAKRYKGNAGHTKTNSLNPSKELTKPIYKSMTHREDLKIHSNKKKSFVQETNDSFSQSLTESKII